MKITAHLSYGEVACHCGCGFGLAPGEFSPDTAAVFEEIREAVGYAIEITSGCRCKRHNAEVGGAPHSYHTQGMALDTLPPDGMTVEDWYDWLDAHVGDQGAVVCYPAPDRHVHIDCRGDGYRQDGRR